MSDVSVSVFALGDSSPMPRDHAYYLDERNVSNHIVSWGQTAKLTCPARSGGYELPEALVRAGSGVAPGQAPGGSSTTVIQRSRGRTKSGVSWRMVSESLYCSRT